MDSIRKEKLLKIEAGLTEHDFPPQLVIENTSYCNQACVHCSHREMTRDKAHMERAVWDKIVEEVGREFPSCEIWPTFYGEALILGDELWDRINYAEKAGCQNLVLNSNGMLVDRQFDQILDSPLKRFILSLDGFTAATYESIRVKGKRDKIFAAVEELIKRKDRRGQKYPSITCQYSLMKENEDDVEPFRAYWSERGAEVKVRRMLEWGGVGTVKSDVVDYETDFRIACPWSANTMAIHQDGSAVACAIDYDGRFIAGNVKDKSVKELWAILGERVRKPHKEHKWDDVPGICQTCHDWQVVGADYEKEKVDGTRPFWFENSVEQG